MDCADELGVSEAFINDPKCAENLEKAKKWLDVPPPTTKPEKVTIQKRRLYVYKTKEEVETLIVTSKGGYPYKRKS